MSYTKRIDLEAGPGETVVELDSGDLIAISCQRSLLHGRLMIQINARSIDHPVKVEFYHTAPLDCDADHVAKQCILAVLGEPNDLRLSQETALSYDIRAQLGAKDVVGDVNVNDIL